MTEVQTLWPVVPLLYHEPPMVLVDRYVADLDEGVACEVDINENKPFFDGQGVPAFVAIEYIAQTIGVFAGNVNRLLGKAPDIGFLLGSKQVTLNCDRFLPGQVLRVEVKRIWDGVKLVQFDAVVTDRDSGKQLVTARMSVYSPNREAADEEAFVSLKGN